MAAFRPPLRALGAGRRDRADALVYHTFLLALALAALFSTTMLLGAPHVFRCMGGQGETLSAALSLFERGVQRRDIDLHAESAWRGRAGNGQHDPALRRYRQQRARTQCPLPSADLWLVTCASVRSGRRRLGSDPIVRRRQSRADRIPPLLVPFAHHPGIP